MRPHILVLDGSVGGRSGNTSAVVERLCQRLQERALLTPVHLVESSADKSDELEVALEGADGFLFATGTYWDSWGSPMQRFLELATDWEGTDLWLGKPAAVVVTMHSVGGKEVLSRLQGVLSTLGVWIPPMSGMVYSLANHLALETDSEFRSDLWQLEDLDVLTQNLLTALAVPKTQWKTWPVDTGDPKRRWIKD